MRAVSETVKSKAYRFILRYGDVYLPLGRHRVEVVPFDTGNRPAICDDLDITALKGLCSHGSRRHLCADEWRPSVGRIR
jgi:hypothetical protein